MNTTDKNIGAVAQLYELNVVKTDRGWKIPSIVNGRQSSKYFNNVSTKDLINDLTKLNTEDTTNSNILLSIQTQEIYEVIKGGDKNLVDHQGTFIKNDILFEDFIQWMFPKERVKALMIISELRKGNMNIIKDGVEMGYNSNELVKTLNDKLKDAHDLIADKESRLVIGRQAYKDAYLKVSELNTQLEAINNYCTELENTSPHTVYVMSGKLKGKSVIKVGFTSHLENRLTQLREMHGIDFSIVDLCVFKEKEVAMELEQKLHYSLTEKYNVPKVENRGTELYYANIKELKYVINYVLAKYRMITILKTNNDG